MNCRQNSPVQAFRRGWALGFASCLILAVAACSAPPPPAVAPPPPPPAPPPPPPPPPPVVQPPQLFYVFSGSPAVLARFPRGTQVTQSTVICLRAGEQITIMGAQGQSLTYNRPGCLRRSGTPSRENEGGFTFGSLGPGLRDLKELAK